MKRLIQIMVPEAVIPAVVWFLAAGRSVTPPAEDPPAAYNMKYCSGRHGAKPGKFAARQWMDEVGINSVFNSIKYGLENPGMTVPFRLITR